MSKISTDHMRTCINTVLEGATEKKREFMETIELQIGLKNYDPQKDKRFAGTIKLPHIPRPKMRVCVLGDAFHCEKAAAMGLEFKNAEGLKNFNKNKKLVRCPPVAARDLPAVLAPLVAQRHLGARATLTPRPPPSPHRSRSSPRSTTRSSRRSR